MPAEYIPPNYIPQYAVEQAEKEKAIFLKNYSQAVTDFRYRFFYNERGDACLEYSITPKQGFHWEFTTWLGYTWTGGGGTIGNNDIVYLLTRKLQDEKEYRIEKRREDPVFREIEKIVLQIATEHNYDFRGVYGIQVKYRARNVKIASCDGYSDAVIKAFAKHPHVASVEKWSSDIGEHAWNVIVLKDGRRLYCDATWYDGNSIDKEGYVVDIPVRDPVNLTFDINEFNTLGGAIDASTGRVLSVHHGWRDAKKD